MWMLWIAHRRKQNLKISKHERTCSLFKILSHRHFGYCATCILLHQNVKFFGGKNVSNWGKWRKRTIHEPIEIKIHNTFMNRGVGKSAFLPIWDIASAMYNWCNICTHEAKMHALQHHWPTFYHCFRGFQRCYMIICTRFYFGYHIPNIAFLNDRTRVVNKSKILFLIDFYLNVARK